MSEFKVGDIIQYVRDQGYTFITLGKEYEVIQSSQYMGRVVIVDDDGDEGAYEEDIFDLVFRVVEDSPQKDSIQKQHSHYFKSVQHLDYIDVYRVLDLFNVTDPCLQHSIKKLLVAGGRGAGKDIVQDVQEAVDSLERWKIMRKEDDEKQT